MSSFLERLNANLEKALAKKKKNKKDSTPESASNIVDTKVTFLKNGNILTPDPATKVKDFLFQVRHFQFLTNFHLRLLSK